MFNLLKILRNNVYQQGNVIFHLSVNFKPSLKFSLTTKQSVPLKTLAILLHYYYFQNIRKCEHKINAVLHCLINFNVNLSLAFAVALCCKVASGCEIDSVKNVWEGHAVVLHLCVRWKTDAPSRSAQVPL